MSDQPDGAPAHLRSSQVRVPKAAELVADSVRRGIIRGELADGDSLPSESALLDQFGISRPTLREAFRVLESERLLSVRRGSHGGAQVHVPEAQVVARYASLVLEHQGTLLSDVFAATALVEAPCAAQTASRGSAAEIGRLRDAVSEELEALDDPGQLLALQTNFHRLVIEVTGSETMLLLSGMLRSIVDVASERLPARNGLQTVDRHASHEGSRAHQKLVELIEAGDAEGAESLWRRHILQTREHLLKGAPTTTILDVLERAD